MYRKKYISWVIGLSILGAAIADLPAIAQPPNQSDITGTNVFDSSMPNLGINSKFDPKILDTAKKLSKDLEDAYKACQASSTAKGPRRFARGPADANQVCATSECQNLNRLVGEARTFLSGLDKTHADFIKLNRFYRIW